VPYPESTACCTFARNILKMEKIKVLAFDDSPARRESLQLLVESAEDMEWSGAFENCEGADQIVTTLRPDVVLMDIQMPKSDGIEGLKMIRKVAPQTLVVMQTVFEDDEKVFTCLQNGAAGYLLKKASPEMCTMEGLLSHHPSQRESLISSKNLM
jgi:DNA-binding NarL/FixJ family response regulator